jgi:hypothetical protein
LSSRKITQPSPSSYVGAHVLLAEKGKNFNR